MLLITHRPLHVNIHSRHIKMHTTKIFNKMTLPRRINESQQLETTVDKHLSLGSQSPSTWFWRGPPKQNRVCEERAANRHLHPIQCIHTTIDHDASRCKKKKNPFGIADIVRTQPTQAHASNEKEALFGRGVFLHQYAPGFLNDFYT
jgi:hypothetical protein